MKTININDNVRLNYISMTKLKTTSAAVFIHRPLRDGEASYNALLPSVLRQGSKLCPDRSAIARYLDNLYGATLGAASIKRGEDQLIYFDAETISDKFAPEGEPLVEDLLRLVMSIVFEPKCKDGAFDETVTAQEKVNAADRIDAFVNDKRQYASSRCQQETARGTDYAILRFGSKEGLSKITAKSLYDYYKSIITSSLIDIYICGDADSLAAERVIREYTDKLAFKQADLPKTEILHDRHEEVHRVTEHMDVAQGKLAVGFVTNIAPDDDDFPALAVMNSVFGAGAHSKLFNNVREKLSLAYYASSQLEKFKGIITVNAGVEFRNFQKAYDEILVQLDEIRGGNISDHEFGASVSAIVNLYNSYFDDQRAMEAYYLSETVAGTNTPLEKFIEKIKKVSVDDVVRAAKRVTLDTAYFLTGMEDE